MTYKSCPSTKYAFLHICMLLVGQQHPQTNTICSKAVTVSLIWKLVFNHFLIDSLSYTKVYVKHFQDPQSKFIPKLRRRRLGCYLKPAYQFCILPLLSLKENEVSSLFLNGGARQNAPHPYPVV